MKTHTADFKNALNNMGRQINSIITYGNTTLHDELYGVTPHFEGNLLKSVMKQLDIESSVNIPIGTIINYQLGVKVGNSYEYLDYGNYIVFSSEKLEDVDKYKIVCYDKMLSFMEDYKTLDITYPITIRNYINALCNRFGITFKNASSQFANYDKEITQELYLDANGNSLGYTYRDVLDELAQVTASIICIDSSTDELQILYPSETNDTINENYLKNVNVKFGKKYGPVNAIVLSRTAGSDNIYYPATLPSDICAVKISDNQIMNWNNRDTFMPDIYQKLNGLEYYVNDFSCTGVLYYELGDFYNVEVGSVTYKCLMLNDEIDVTQGIEELIHTELMEESETDYSKADKTDIRINQAYSIVDKQNGQITNLISQVGNREGQTQSITEQIEQMNITIQGITNEVVQKGGNNLFYYSKDFWDGQQVTITQRRTIRVGDDLSGKKIYLSFPTTSPANILDYNTGNVITCENGDIFHSTYVGEISSQEFVSVYYNEVDTMVYDMQSGSYITNLSEYTLPNNFGVVTQINVSSGVYPYVQIDVTETEEVLNIEEYTNTDFSSNTISGRGYIINDGSSYQDTNNTGMAVPNGMYTISFLYKKIGPVIANVSVKINDGEAHSLTATSWTKFSETIEVTTNHIKIEFISDTDNALYVADLLGNSGTQSDIWTQNPNETRTDTVTIGKGIRVDSSEKNTYHRIDADGNRTYNKATGEVVSEQTDKGTLTKELIVREKAEISGLLIQEIDGQIWLSSLL